MFALDHTHYARSVHVADLLTLEEKTISYMKKWQIDSLQYVNANYIFQI